MKQQPNWQLSLFTIAVCITFHYSTYAIPYLAWFGQVSWPLVVAFFVWRYRLDAAESIGWRLPRWRDWGLAVLMSLAMVWVVLCVIDFQNAFFRSVDYDVAKDYRHLEREIDEIKEQGIVVAVLAAAVWAAIREEIVFRGMGLSGLARSWGPWLGIAVSSILFGLAHASIGRFLPTFLLGFGFGLIAIGSRSVFPAMLAHALNNFIALYFAEALEASRLKVLLCSVSLVMIALYVVYVRATFSDRRSA